MLGLKYELLFRSDMPDSEARLLETIRTLSGIVWDGYSPEESSYSRVAEKIAKTGIPFLVISREKTAYDTILLDSEQEADAVAEFARKNGHENILFLSDLGNLPYPKYLTANPTCPAIWRRLRKDGRIPRNSYCSLQQLKSRLQNKNFLKKYSLIYTRRTLVREVLDILKEHNIRVPEDLSLFGVYDTPWSRHFNLGTCRVDPRKFADAVARAVFAGGSGSVEYVDCDVIERSSVKPEMKTVNGK